MLRKNLKNYDFLLNSKKFLNKRIKKFFLIFIFLFSLPFILLFFSNNLYILLIDVSSSMSLPVQRREGITEKRIDALFNAITKFIDNKNEGKFMVITYSDHGIYPNAPFTVLDSIVNYHSPYNFGGHIVVNLSNDKEYIKKSIRNYIKNFNYGNKTFLSEALYKTLFIINQRYEPLSKVNILIYGDGDDQNYCINEENNVILSRKWNFYDKLKVHTIMIGANEEGIRNFRILSSSGKGKYIDVKYVEDFYQSLLQFSKNEDIIIIHIIILLFLLSLFVFVFLKK